MLIANGAEVNARVNGGTPLDWAAVKNAAEVAKVLIANGAEVNAKNKYSQTPLHWAAGENAAEVAKVLIANGAEVNAKTNTARRLCIGRREKMRRKLRKC